MEITRLNMIYDLLFFNNKSPYNTRENNSEFLKPINKIYFLICNSCYWYASYFGIDYLEEEILSKSLSSHIFDCHICKSGNTGFNTGLIPISTDESFRIEYNQTRGMKIEFYRSNRVAPRKQVLVPNILSEQTFSIV